MNEFILLQEQCLSSMNSQNTCDSCSLGYFCRLKGCSECDCSKCLNEIHHGHPPRIDYSCPRITYHYTLRFFNRFASEIYYRLEGYQPQKDDVYVVSLGCGPGSEIYGFLKYFRDNGITSNLYYEGYDINTIWNNVQTMTKGIFQSSQHSVVFKNIDMFNGFCGFPNNAGVDFLVLNYLLSDAISTATNNIKVRLVNSIADFVVGHKVKYVLFNDFKFFGYKGNFLDSAYKMMLLLVDVLRKNIQINVFYQCFDQNCASKEWNIHNSNLVFQNHQNNTYTNNISSCGSIQIIIEQINV